MHSARARAAKALVEECNLRSESSTAYWVLPTHGMAMVRLQGQRRRDHRIDFLLDVGENEKWLLTSFCTFSATQVYSNRLELGRVMSNAAGAGPRYPWVRRSESQSVQDLISAAADALRAENCKSLGRTPKATSPCAKVCNAATYQNAQCS